MNAQADALMGVFGLKRVKQKKCRNCKQLFTPARPLQTVCSPSCAQQLINSRKAKEQAKQDKIERQLIRERKLELKKPQYWLKRAEKAVNAFIRERDRDQPCISCGTYDASEWHAGHWVSVGASSALRYDPANIHKQCHQCNWFEGGKSTDYEARLPARIGHAEFERVKYAKRERKWTREECQQIEAHYRAKLKEMKGEQ